MIRSAGLMICLLLWVVAFPAARSAGQGPGDLPATLTHDNYPDLITPEETVSTIAVGSVVAVEKTDGRSRQALRSDRSVERFFETIEKLRQPPDHVEWREVAISAPMDGWTRFPPAEQWLKNYPGDGPLEGGNQQGGPLGNRLSAREIFERAAALTPFAAREPHKSGRRFSKSAHAVISKRTGIWAGDDCVSSARYFRDRVKGVLE